ncbi:MAG: translocation/assembly module TamB domain-containing protein, partial [Gemmatimonadota bacterium]
ELHVAGTRDAPTFNGSASVISPVIGDAHFPSVLTTFDYGNQRLHSNVSLWRTGIKVLDGSATLPLDLALAARNVRKLPGELQIAAAADSVDLIVLEALIPGMTDATGTMRLNLKGSGTWLAPRLEGLVGITDGGMRIPSLGVRYAPINMLAHFVKDSLRIDSMLVGDDDGSLGVKGGMRFAELSKPTMDLHLSARDFLAIDAPGFMTVRATGDVRLTGPLLQPVLTGSEVFVSRSVLYFADLINKNVIDLENPDYASLIDVAAIQRRGLGNQFSNRFLDSLRIEGLQLRIGTEVWLRSAEANIQLDGLLQVDKAYKQYTLTGDLNATRGTYTLRLGPISRDFIVDQGLVRYFGSTDFNADLQIKAHQQVRTLDGDDFNVEATITGSILQPKVTLASPGRTLTQRDLASYILFGRPEFQVTGSNSQLGGSAVNYALNVLTSELSHSAVNSKQFGLTSLTLRPGASTGSVTSGPLQLAAGLQLGPRWFVTFNAGACLNQSQSFQTKNFGASAEYRLNREFRFQASAEPVQSCISNRATDVFTTLNRYQLGWTFLWRRDY